MKKLYASLPCYNEQENVQALVAQWLAQRESLLARGYQLLIVGIDDKSTDTTAVLLERMAAQYKEVTMLKHKVNRGLGGALNSAVTFFLDNAQEGDICVLMDGDNTHSPEFVHSMLDKIDEGAGTAIASRYQSGAEIHGVPKIRLLLSDGAKVYYTAMLRVPNVRDYTCGYRAYTYKSLKAASEKYGAKLITQRSFACMMELLYKLYKSGTVFAEVPFNLRYDQKGGDSKMRVMKTVISSLKTAFLLRIGKI